MECILTSVDAAGKVTCPFHDSSWAYCSRSENGSARPVGAVITNQSTGALLTISLEGPISSVRAVVALLQRSSPQGGILGTKRMQTSEQRANIDACNSQGLADGLGHPSYPSRLPGIV